MDNNTPFSDDSNSQSSQDSLGVSDDVLAENSKINKKNLPIILIGVALLVFAIYIFSSIFSAPKKPTGPNPMNSQTNDRTIRVPESDKAENPDNNIPSNAVDLPQPPVAMIQPPPPAEPLSYSPPLISPTIGLDAANKNNTLAGISRVPAISDEPPPPPPLPALVPPTPEITNIGKSNNNLAAKDKDTKKRVHSNMLVLDGGATGGSSSSSSSKTSPTNDPNSAFSDNVLKATTADKAIATGLNNLNMTIAQGKIINAVLETAVNTDLPGTLRAIVSRDTYAETGRTVLIPKGSRLIGTYNTGILQGQSRVMVVWTRLIRPDGVDIMIGSPGIDQLGRAGVKGEVDNKLYDIFSAAILTTVFTVAAAAGADAIVPTQNGQVASTTTNTNGNTTTTATPAQQAAANAVSDFGNTGKEIVQRIVDIRPTITIDQGTLVNVFVNRDLTFPSNADGNVFVQ